MAPAQCWLVFLVPLPLVSGWVRVAVVAAGPAGVRAGWGGAGRDGAGQGRAGQGGAGRGRAGKLSWASPAAVVGRGRDGLGAGGVVAVACWPGGGVQVLGGAERCGGLGGVLLGLAQFRDGFGEGGQPDEQHDQGERAVAG
jgi:hypothetical protein